MTWLASLFSFLSAPVTEIIKNRGEVKAAKHKRELAVINNQARLASDEQSHNHEWEMASLKNQDTSLRWCSFWLFALPILITVISPEYGAVIWENLALVPQWCVTVFISMIGGIKGIVELKKAIPQIAASFKK